MNHIWVRAGLKHIIDQMCFTDTKTKERTARLFYRKQCWNNLDKSCFLEFLPSFQLNETLKYKESLMDAHVTGKHIF